jgi:hypothetical protein
LPAPRFLASFSAAYISFAFWPAASDFRQPHFHGYAQPLEHTPAACFLRFDSRCFFASSSMILVSSALHFVEDFKH